MPIASWLNWSVVRRTVIEDHDAEVVVILGEYAAGSLWQGALHVADGHHHVHEGPVFMRSGLHPRLGARWGRARHLSSCLFGRFSAGFSLIGLDLSPIRRLEPPV